MDENRPVSQVITSITPPEQPGQPEQPEQSAPKVPVGIIIAAVLIVVALITGMIYLLNADAETTAQIRDVFIIFLALESLVIGIALVILIIQLATLINLLNNEVRPIINSTNETVNTIKGTVSFLSDNLSEPVIKMNEYLAGFQKFLEIVRFGRR
jgi:hypothetical protein